jgi:DNA gyrase/topoisomerase IV subunit A
VYGTPALHLQKLEHQQDRLEEERRGLEVTLHIPDGDQGARYKLLEEQISTLEKERRIIESAEHYGLESGLRSEEAQKFEEEVLRVRKNWYISLTLLLFVLFSLYLPTWFRFVASGGHDDHAAGTAAEHDHSGATMDEHDHAATMVMPDVSVSDAIRTLNTEYGIEGGSPPIPAPAASDGHDHAH